MVMWGVGEDEMKGRHGLLTTVQESLGIKTETTVSKWMLDPNTKWTPINPA